MTEYNYKHFGGYFSNTNISFTNIDSLASLLSDKKVIEKQLNECLEERNKTYLEYYEAKKTLDDKERIIKYLDTALEKTFKDLETIETHLKKIYKDVQETKV
jgi:DNA-binding phage protein